MVDKYITWKHGGWRPRVSRPRPGAEELRAGPGSEALEAGAWLGAGAGLDWQLMDEGEAALALVLEHAQAATARLPRGLTHTQRSFSII